jgi:hypothetical protein
MIQIKNTGVVLPSEFVKGCEGLCGSTRAQRFEGTYSTHFQCRTVDQAEKQQKAANPPISKP